PKNADPLAEKVNAAVAPLRKANDPFEDRFRALTAQAKTGWGDSYDKLSADLEDRRAEEARLVAPGADPESLALKRESIQDLRRDRGKRDREHGISQQRAELDLRRLGERMVEDRVRYDAKVEDDRAALKKKAGDGPKELADLKTKLDAAEKKIQSMKPS